MEEEEEECPTCGSKKRKKVDPRLYVVKGIKNSCLFFRLHQVNERNCNG